MLFPLELIPGARLMYWPASVDRFSIMVDSQRYKYEFVYLLSSRISNVFTRHQKLISATAIRIFNAN